MKPNVIIEIPAGTLATMTFGQFKALRDNIVAEGKWENVEAPVVRVSGGDYIGVHLPTMFIGIEKDGYTHS